MWMAKTPADRSPGRARGGTGAGDPGRPPGGGGPGGGATERDGVPAGGLPLDSPAGAGGAGGEERTGGISLPGGRPGGRTGTVPGEVWLSVAPGVGVRLTKDGKLCLQGPVEVDGTPHGERAGGGPMTAILRNGDYCPDGMGGFRQAWGGEEVLERVLFQLTARRGSFPLLPQVGSRLYLLGRAEAGGPGDRGGRVCRRGPGRRSPTSR